MASASISDAQDTFSLTFASQPKCMLLEKLPGELRNEIIRLAVVEDSEIKPKVIRSYNETTSHWTAKLELDHAIMHTCKQLRQESAEIYFLENTFRLTEDFLTQSPLVNSKQHKANERAIQVLAHAFGPWASKVPKLCVSHAIYCDTPVGSEQQRSRRAEVHVSICRAAQGVYLEDARALDTLSQGLCCCIVIQYAANNSSAGIFEMVEGLVCMLDLVAWQRSPPHCWNCGLEPMT